MIRIISIIILNWSLYTALDIFEFPNNAKVLFQTGKTNRYSTMKGRRLGITREWGKQQQRAQANLPVLICTLFLFTDIASIYTSRRERWVKKGLQDYNQVNGYVFIIKKLELQSYGKLRYGIPQQKDNIWINLYRLIGMDLNVKIYACGRIIYFFIKMMHFQFVACEICC